MYISDLHIHSRFSRATSKEGDPEHLQLFARKKGIQVVGTGDFTHPQWRKELEEKLEEDGRGFYKLKKEYQIEDSMTPDSIEPRFVVTGEISSIYKKKGKTRKVHNLLILPGLEEAEKLSAKLETIGNIHSDGRPILGLDSRDLLEIMLELCPQGIFVPAHIWTPHFAMFGAFSGFDSVEECFEDLTPYVHAVETGLSSDPPMNWRVSMLDKYQLISNSDAHSPGKLGREANLMNGEMSYEGLQKAIQTGEDLYGTIEFFPEEGKYHYDGHRKCHLCLSPSQTREYEGRCPVCGKKITIGVEHRVEELADRDLGYVRKNAKPFESLMPLPELIAQATRHSAASVKVQRQYGEMLANLGPEFEILREVPIEDIKREAGYFISEGVRRLRQGQVERIPGFDGEYGTIKLFQGSELEDTEGQISFFDVLSPGTTGHSEKAAQKAEENRGNPVSRKKTESRAAERQSLSESAEFQSLSDVPEFQSPSDAAELQSPSDIAGIQMPSDAEEFRPLSDVAGLQPPAKAKRESAASGLNQRQRQAVEALEPVVAVIAGPDTGKTKTLVSKILYLMEYRKVKPSQITAVTFTNKAAREMQERVGKELGNERTARMLHMGTFHSICLDLLKKKGEDFILGDHMLLEDLAGETIREFNLEVGIKDFLLRLSLHKCGSALEEEKEWQKAFSYYQGKLKEGKILDFDDLLLETMTLLDGPDGEALRGQSFQYLLVDEFQDINPLQYQLILKWNQGGRELFVIGDPDQSIYGFRGSDEKCFLRLKEDRPELSVITLTENYRSFRPVVESGEALMKVAPRQRPGKEESLQAIRGEGSLLRVVQTPTELSQGIFIAKEINRQAGGLDMLDTQKGFSRESERRQKSFSDMAILYRTHSQARLLERCLQQEGIPYVVAGRDDFLSDAKVRGSVGFFRSLLWEEEELSRGLGLKLLWKLPENDITSQIYLNMKKKYRPLVKKGKPSKVLEAWISDMNLEKNPAMEKLRQMSLLYSTMEEFLQALSLGTEGELVRCGGKSYSSDAVTLMTLHGSKGLEFPLVFLWGVQEGKLPLESSSHKADEAEERRLFFVGITRARDELILTYTGQPSKFLKDIPEELCVQEEGGKRKEKPEARQMSLFDFM